MKIRYVATSDLKPHPEAALVPPMRANEWRDFLQDITMRGIKVPLEVAGDGTILDGHHRHKAAVELAIPQLPVIDAVLGQDTTTIYMLKAAVLRRQLTDDQRDMMATFWKDNHKQEPGRPTKEKHSNTEGRPSVLTNDHPTELAASKLFNVNPWGIKKATYLNNKNPELAKAVHNGDIGLNQAIRQVKKQERPSVSAALPSGVFNVVLADPPWPYSNSLWGGAVEDHYNTLSIDEICKLAFGVADNAVLFLWVTAPFCQDAFRVISAWGFEYKTNMVWVKTELKKPGSGFYVRGRHELLFICVRGSFIPDQVGKEPIGSVIESPIQEHSRKPEVVYQIIETMYPNCKYLELFARNKRDGWECWGNELNREA